MQYIIALDNSGKVIANTVVGVHKKTLEELREYVRKEYPDAQYLECESEIWAELQRERARWDGTKVVIDPEPEKSPEELQKQALDSLNAEFEPKITEKKNQIIEARTVYNDEELAKELTSELDNLIADYTKKRGEL